MMYVIPLPAKEKHNTKALNEMFKALVTLSLALVVFVVCILHIYPGSQVRLD